MKSRGGFTLVELLVAMAVLAVLVAAMMRMLFQVEHAKEAGFQKAEIQANGRAGMELFVREARMAGANMPDLPIRAFFNGQPFTLNSVVPYASTNLRDSVKFFTAYDNVNFWVSFKAFLSQRREVLTASYSHRIRF